MLDKHMEQCIIAVETPKSATEVKKTQGIIIVPNPNPYFGDITIMPE